MHDHKQHGFIYRGGNFLASQPSMRHQPQSQFADHPYMLDLGAHGSVQFSTATMETLTVQFVEALTAHGTPSLDVLDRILYLAEECRINHPDSSPWANAAPLSIPAPGKPQSVIYVRPEA
jgi:hypothetical protein